jgi:hypothetical protein
VQDHYFAVYIVTAKHVLQSTDDYFCPEIYVRLNRKGQASCFIQIKLSELKVHIHKDEDVDLAIFLFYPSQNVFDYLYILTFYLPTRERLNEMMNEGDEVFYAGLFANYYGTENNYPILRFGRVSLLTNEKIEINQYNEPQKLAHLYLFEIQSYSGNSGSPVFFQLARIGKNKIYYGNPEIHLVGVMKGHYNDVRMRKVVNLKDELLQQLNNGIAMVTPSYFLREILFSENVTKERMEAAKDQGIL